jgi:type II secretory pathway predicted ATPase ExeA
MNFKAVKELFRDKVDVNLYVPLSQKKEIDLTYAIYEKEKIILVFGEAGNGKTFLIKKIYQNLQNKENKDFKVYFISNPFEESEAIDELFILETTEHRVVFIDEAQTLSEEKIERLRMLADNQPYTIILSTHEKEAKKIFAKKHFQTRINYFINLKPLKLDKIELFIHSKLVQNDAHQIASLFTKSNYKLIYKLTRGNLREINRLIYKTFDIIDYFQAHYPQKVSKNKIDNKYIEMAYMDLKGVDA